MRLLLSSGMILLAAASRSFAASDSEVSFNRSIRPILSENCYACHGPDKSQRKAKLRLDVREAALAKKAFVPGKPAESELIKRIFSTKPDEQMPPPESHKSLTPEEKRLLERWIAQGARYEPHWAYIPPKRWPTPRVRNAAWVRNPIDAFILEKLEARRIRPSPEADKRTLLRRLSLDLTGVPPTVEEMENFLLDARPDAYQRQVDRLLKSPHYGERMAVPWLDAVRFSDTVGYHGDQNQNIFPYRDYVIDSFNQNKPFDQFTIEQIAGDLLPHPTAEQEIASGFNRLNLMTREGGAQPKEYLAKYAADRVRTVSMAWLGSTMGCAECHDHKFDPFSTRDFYQMEAFFADLKQWGVYQDYSYTPNPDLKGWSNDHPFPPELVADSPYLHARLAKFQKKIDALDQSFSNSFTTDPASKKEFREWRAQIQDFARQHPDGWSAPTPEASLLPPAKSSKTAADARAAVLADDSILLDKTGESRLRVELPLPDAWLAAIRVELLPRPEHGGTILANHGENTGVSFAAELQFKTNSQPLKFFHAEADWKEERYSNGSAVIGVTDRWRTSIAHRRERQQAVWILNAPRRVHSGEKLALTFEPTGAGCVRISWTPLGAQRPLACGEEAVSLACALAKADADWAPAERAEAARAFFFGTGATASAWAQYQQWDREVLECRNGKSPTMVSVSVKPRITRILPRGNWQDDSGAIVEPETPHFLPQPPNPEHRRLTRLDLARWLVSRDNPLTARAIMNRMWKQFFGAGISAVLNDLGAQGEWPTHPELLDWLSVEFMDSGWNVKHMARLMVLSSTYRQCSNERPELKEIDPTNRLLARQNPRRLEAEFVRDNALFIAGLLNEEMGGPSVHPYQPAGYYANLQFPDREYHADQDDRQYRRGVYMHWQRTFLHPMLANFDAPSREECAASRTVSNTPQQALTLLNDPTFVEAARVFASHIVRSSPPADSARFDAVFERALGRPIKSREESSLEPFLHLQLDHYRAHPDEAAKLLRVGLAPAPTDEDPVLLAAWTQVCRVVLNLHECITEY